MTESLDDILDDLFHGSAWQAYLEQAAIQQGLPDMNATRARAYRLYEEALAERRRLESILTSPSEA